MSLASGITVVTDTSTSSTPTVSLPLSATITPASSNPVFVNSSIPESSALQSLSSTNSPSATTANSAPSSLISGQAVSSITFSTVINATAPGPTSLTFTTAIALPAASSNKIASGAAAGIGIGTAVIGAIIAIIAMLAVQKKRRRRSRISRPSTHDSSTGYHGPAEALTSRANEKAVATTSVTDPDYLLPQPKDDQSMAATANQLFVHIGNHVENFYHNNSVREALTPRSEQDELLLSRKTRHAALKKHICQEMMAAIAWDCKPENSLLSPAAAAIAHKMARSDLDESTYEVAWSRWRVSTALLLVEEEDSPKVAARRFWVDRLQSRLKPFQLGDPESVTAAQEDLWAICKLAEDLATVVCSQPARWEFKWPRSDVQGQMIISPEFVRVTDNKARKLERPRRALEAQRTY